MVAAEGFILDASPLILLTKIRAFDLLGRLAQQVVVSAAVLEEVQAGPRRDWELPNFGAIGWLRIEPDRPVAAITYSLLDAERIHSRYAGIPAIRIAKPIAVLIG